MKSPEPVLVPPGVVTMTSAAPAVPTGVVAVSVEALTTVMFEAAAPPIKTEVAFERSVPVIVTLVPPSVLPLLGEMLVTGDATAKL